MNATETKAIIEILAIALAAECRASGGEPSACEWLDEDAALADALGREPTRAEKTDLYAAFVAA